MASNETDAMRADRAERWSETWVESGAADTLDAAVNAMREYWTGGPGAEWTADEIERIKAQSDRGERPVLTIDGFPPLTFRPEEWRMVGEPTEWPVSVGKEGKVETVLKTILPLETVLKTIAPLPPWVEPEPEDDIMSAVRAVARGS